MIPFNPFSALASKIYGAVAIAALTFATVQTVRIEGLPIWFIGFDGLKADNDRLRGQVDAMNRASVEAGRKALTAKLATEAHYKDLANDADKEYAAALVAAHDATAQYIAANRVRQDSSHTSGRTITSADDHGAEVSAPVSTSVIMDQADVRNCGDLYTYAVNAHNWAETIGE